MYQYAHVYLLRLAFWSRNWILPTEQAKCQCTVCVLGMHKCGRQNQTCPNCPCCIVRPTQRMYRCSICSCYNILDTFLLVCRTVSGTVLITAARGR